MDRELYKPQEYIMFCKDVKRIFHNLEIKWDVLLSIINNRIVIDIQDLEIQLKNLYPTEYKNLSMYEIISKHYGVKAIQFIINYL